MSSVTSLRAAAPMAARALLEKVAGVVLLGDQGAKPMLTGRLDSVSVQLSATTAVALPFVVVLRLMLGCTPAEVAPSKEATWWERAHMRSFWLPSLTPPFVQESV